MSQLKENENNSLQFSCSLDKATIQSGLDNNGKLSGCFKELALMQLKDPGVAKTKLNFKSEDIPLFMQSYSYVVSPWPIVIDQHVQAKLQEMCATMPGIFNKVLRQVAKQDRAFLLEYLNINELQLDLALQRDIDTRDIVARWDAIFSNGQIKLIEINVGSMIGGLHMACLSDQMLNLLKQYSVSKNWDLVDRNGFDKFFNSVNQSIARLKGRNATGKSAYFLPVKAQQGFDVETVESLKEFLKREYKQQLPEHLQETGDLFFCNAIEKLDFRADKKLYFDDVELDAIILSADGDEQIPRALYSLLEAGVAAGGQYYFPDSISYTLLGIKLLFGLIQEPKIQHLLTDEERLMISKFIPFTTRLCSDFSFYNGKLTPVKQIIEQEKDRLVIKKSVSMQGKDVMIGRAVSQQEWLSFYQQYKDDPDWLLQEMCIPDKYISADPVNGVDTYKMNWGVFSFAGNYSGTMIRGMPQSGSDIVNSAQGAVEFAVLEEQKYKNKITL
ncbi:hypothetical protein [Pseudoalteromonas rubra]|uniref:hypothetical protein n=1 Tax=Pseudoalteromonas rubra TaxID=43658 RepID=UPI000F7AEBCD|nr:hypothetical protein [Pseudoalteromonas rubra]